MLIELDLAGADWMVVALLSRDPNMLEVAHSGKSPHAITGRLMSGVSEELVLKENKLVEELKDPEEIANVRRNQIPEILTASFLPRTMSIRQAAKKGNHGGNYREGYRMFALTNEMEESEAKNILNRYTCQSPSHGRFGHSCGDVAYPGIRDWWDRIDHEVRKTRHLENCFGRKLFFSGQMGEDLFKQAYAFLPQSTVFDITAQAMSKFMDDSTEAFAAAEMRAQVHDSLLFDYLSLNFRLMAQFIQGQKIHMSTPVNYGEPFTINVTAKAGLNWKNKHDIAITDNVTEMADALEALYLKLKKDSDPSRVVRTPVSHAA